MTTKEFEKGRTNAKKEIRNENPFRIFENEKFGELEIFMEEGIIWIEATKAAKILGYKNPHKAIKDHCINEYPYLTIRSVGVETGKKRDNSTALQFVDKKYINEGNLYRLITKSKLPEAREFERWIFDTVIPSIRKHGYYSNVPQIDEKDIAMLSIIKSVSEEERSIAFSKYQERFVIPMQKELEVARPKAETYDEFLDADGTITLTTLAISFGLQSARLFNEIMHNHGVIAKAGKSWRPSKKYINEKIMKAVEFGYNPQKKKNENSALLLENNLDKSNEVSTEIVILNNDNIVSDEKETKGVMFKWTLTGLEVAKRILLENEYIEKIDEKYVANSEKIAEFKKNYKRAKQKN